MADYVPMVEAQLEKWRQTGDIQLLHSGLTILTSQLQEAGEANKRHNEVMTELALQRQRLEAFDQRFEDLLHSMDKRFEAVDQRFESIDKRFEDMFRFSERRFNQINWVMGLGFTLLVTLVSLYNFL